ncbi:probable zinc transporter protein DDB_G0291141 [Vigna radiata var. radiata]|uniref:Probable zinc transporter protein DDB_G0291141 n=1 Tax=Vigna radiata var. radiata TaxID=3916 RepID=A0A1S3ULQ7_VIGRR|nr:probable zinc transporter protein DDB_G0291141 [Vigna radiata var. radiata]
MADHDHDHDHGHSHPHHHHHRPQRLSVPPRTPTFGGTPGPYPALRYSPFPTPTATPSKGRRLPASFSIPKSKSKSRSSLFLLLFFSLRSLYSLLPFLRSSPSFSLFPFSFLVSLLSFTLTLTFSLFSSSSSSKDNPFLHHKPKHSLFSLPHSHQRILIIKSVLLALVFLLRFQALRYCSTASMILAELMGSVAAQPRNPRRPNLRGFLFLSFGLLMLSFGWDRVECFPFSPSCVSGRIWPLFLPFMSGFLTRYKLIDSGTTLKQLGNKRVRLITLFFTTVILFVPAVFSFFVFESEEDSVAFGNLLWPLANTVIFGVLLSESYSDDDNDDDGLVSLRDSQREFLVTFVCTLVLELFYFPELSLWGLLLCGLFLYIGVRDLDPFHSNEDEFFSDVIMKPIRHVLSERKSRKIALFLLINAGYMVVEFSVGFMSNSLGLISDACHMLFDCAALAIGLYASYISRLPANNHYNYGRGRFEVLSGYANAVFLVLVGALIVVESFERILDPQEISTNSLLVVSIGGLLVNVIGLIFFHEEHHHAHGHGWSGSSCSHSHSHSELHNHHHTHHDHDHDHLHCHPHETTHVSHNKFISIPSDNRDYSCSSDHGDHHSHNHYSHGSKHHGECHDHEDNHSIQSHKHHEAAHCHDHGEHHIDHGHDHGEHHIDHSHDHEEAPLVDKEHGHHHIDHNMEGIFLHVLADTLGSVGVVISTLLIKYKGWLIADPACSIFISILIVSSVIPLLKNSAEVLLQRVPRVQERELKDALSNVLKIKGVYGIQKFHVWSFTNTDVVGTLHLHLSTDTDKTSAKSQVLHLLHNAGIKDVTLQVECVG